MSTINSLNIVPTFNDNKSQTLSEFRKSVCMFLQTQINQICDNARDQNSNSCATEFQIVWQSEVIASVKFDIRTVHKKITECRLSVTPLGDRALAHEIEASSALAASYFIAGVAGRS